MELLRNILLLSSCILLVALAVQTGKKLNLPGMPGLLAVILTFLIWNIGNLIEMNSSDFNLMLLGRNIEQIGVFFTPLGTLYFSIRYTSNRKLMKFVYIISVVQVIAVLLLFTDQYHHLMRETVEVRDDALFGSAIAVESTKLGSVFVAFDFCIPLITIAILIIFMRTISVKLRRPLVLIIISIFATIAIAAFHTTVLNEIGANIPIPVLDIPCLVLMSYAVLGSGFLGAAPIVLDKVFEVIDQGIIVVNENGIIIEHNKRASELMNDMSGPDPDPDSGGIKTGSDILEFMYGAKDTHTGCFSVDNLPAELKITQNNRYISLTHHKLEASGERFAGYVVVLTDITLLKVRAEIDYLTGVYNREGLTNAFSYMQRLNENGSSVSAMLIDMDNFKKINDTHGHFGGDMILKDLACAVRAYLPKNVVLGRLGGDEFAVLLRAELEETAVLAENLRKCVACRAVQYLNNEIHYTVSIGIASCTNSECDLSDLLHTADSALYNAKNKGKNSVST